MGRFLRYLNVVSPGEPRDSFVRISPHGRSRWFDSRAVPQIRGRSLPPIHLRWLEVSIESPHTLIITRLDILRPDPFAEMLAESEASGYRFLRRVLDHWESGVDRFSRPGEALLVAELDRRWVGVCGLSIDPYLDDPRIGRVRNVYVLAEFRRCGIGRRLVQEAVSRARGRFDRLRLRTEEAGPTRLYESLGFHPRQSIPDCTHIMDLRPAT